MSLDLPVSTVRRACKWVLYVGVPVLGHLRGRWLISRFMRMYKKYLQAPRRCTNQDAQYLLRQAFLASKGAILHWAWQLQPKRKPAVNGSFCSRLFPALDEEVVAQATKALRDDGFYVLPWKISNDWLDSVANKAMALDVIGGREGNDIQKLESIQPKQAVYEYRPQDLATISEIKEFARDPGLRTIAAAYFESVPVIDHVCAWWTFPVSGEADSGAAQLYHYDLDRIRWLKIFVYLTDVDEVSGPHAFIRGSHRTIGSKVSRDGRYSDAEVFSMYDRADEVVFIAPRGTVILEDTLGLHKGIPAISKRRFILQVQLSINYFGYPNADFGV